MFYAVFFQWIIIHSAVHQRKYRTTYHCPFVCMRVSVSVGLRPAYTYSSVALTIPIHCLQFNKRIDVKLVRSGPVRSYLTYEKIPPSGRFKLEFSTSK